jgi:hypothetical protein
MVLMHKKNLFHTAIEENLSEHVLNWLLETCSKLLYQEDASGVIPLELASCTDKNLYDKIINHLDNDSTKIIK